MVLFVSPHHQGGLEEADFRNGLSKCYANSDKETLASLEMKGGPAHACSSSLRTPTLEGLFGPVTQETPSLP